MAAVSCTPPVSTHAMDHQSKKKNHIRSSMCCRTFTGMKIVFNVQINKSYKLCIFCIETIQNDDQVQWVPLSGKQNNAIYLPIFNSFINHNLNSTKLFNSLSRDSKQGRWLAASVQFSISTRITAGTQDACWLESEAQQCISRRIAQKPREILAGKRHNAGNALTDFKCLWRKDLMSLHSVQKGKQKCELSLDLKLCVTWSFQRLLKWSWMKH